MMKQIVVLLLAFSSVGFGRNGLSAGYNQSQFYGNHISFFGGNPKTIPGFSIGIFSEINIENQFSLNVELLYSTKGSVFNENTEDEFKYILNYFEVPVCIQYNVNKELRIPIILSAGFYGGFFINGSEYWGTLETDLSKKPKTDFGYVLGILYSMNNEAELGLSMVNGREEIDLVNYNHPLDWKNRVMRISLRIFI